MNRTTKRKSAVSKVARIPSLKECFRIMERLGMMVNIRRHSCVVARVAVVLGQALNRKGSRLNIRLILAGALLHDIAKTSSLRDGGDHVEMGQRTVLAMGYPEVARVVGRHVDGDPGIANLIDEAAVVNYADKRVQHDRIVPLKERFKDLVARYGKTPERCGRLEEMERNVQKLEGEICSRISVSPEDLSQMAGGPQWISLPETEILKV
jgi:putative nucleotidyltransferase with HDIG domain